jgi:hypothetical protein
MIWGQPSSRVDERDTMFARMARRQRLPAYEEYYRRRPDLKATDDRLRAMPELLRPGGDHFDPVICIWRCAPSHTGTQGSTTS